LHGGTVEAASAGAGHGSTFIIRLPCLRIGGHESPAVVGGEGGQTAKAPICRILVADDNVDAAESLALVMRMWNHHVCVAHTGAAALEMALTERPQVCILDIGMPGMTGYEVAARIRSQPWGADTVLFALTGWGQSEDVERAKAAGFDEHMTKPVDLVRLAELLANHEAAENSSGCALRQ
jgi:CheY-like chemotaxis protein